MANTCEAVTRPDIEGIRAKCEAATPGPWLVEDPHVGLERNVPAVEVAFVDTEYLRHMIYTLRPVPPVKPGHVRADWASDRYPIPGNEVLANAAFIATSRTDVPTLLVYIDALEPILGSVGQYMDHKLNCGLLRDQSTNDCTCGYFKTLDILAALLTDAGQATPYVQAPDTGTTHGTEGGGQTLCGLDCSGWEYVSLERVREVLRDSLCGACFEAD